MNTKGLIVVFVLILVAGCTSSHRNYSVKENYSTTNAPFDSLIIHFNYGESAPDTIVEWALYKNGDLRRHISYGGEYAGDSCKIQMIKGEKQQIIRQLVRDLFVDHSCSDIIKTKSNRVASDCGELCVDVYYTGKKASYKYDFGYDVQYSHELNTLIKQTALAPYTTTKE